MTRQTAGRAAPTALLSTVPVFTRTPSGPPSEVDVEMRHLGLSSRGLVAPAAGSQPPAVHIQSLMEMGLKGPAVKSNQAVYAPVSLRRWPRLCWACWAVGRCPLLSPVPSSFRQVLLSNKHNLWPPENPAWSGAVLGLCVSFPTSQLHTGTSDDVRATR